MNKPVYSIVIPVYRSSSILDELHQRLVNVFEKSVLSSFEIIMVNDASPDNSWNKMMMLHHKDARVKIINLTRNFGQHNATLCGFNHISGEFVITLDDDLQHPPEEIPKLINEMKNDPSIDIVIGDYISKKHSFIRNLGTRTMNIITSMIAEKDPKLHLTSFRLIRASIIHEIIKVIDDKPRIGYLLVRYSRKIVNVRVQHDERKSGQSGYTLMRLFKDLINNIMNNSFLPLKFISIIGFSSAVLSLILALFYIYKYLFIGVSIKGWTTIVLLLLFYFGVILFSIGIIGKYLIKILTGIKHYPQFVIREKHF